jgi:N-methylhydantoinase A/oxoprolinase/acetone carboxylase beta subunit
LRQIAVDVGGTFTDVFLLGDEGDLIVHKVPSTPQDPSIATVEGMGGACEKAGLRLADLDLVFHGTTVATNTVLQRSGARVGLLTTEGFRDVLHIARHKKPMNYSLYQELPWQKQPLVPRHLRLPVPERVEPPGTITKPLDEDALRGAIGKLRDEGVEAVAVCFLHSYLAPAHEQRVAELLEELLPGPFVSLRHEVCPEYREYEAFNTVVVNAYVGPVTGEYLARLSRRLGEEGVEGDVLFMTSSGGVEPTETVSRKPVSMLLSGPAGGVIGGRETGRAAGFENLITLDVGGTSADIGVIHQGQVRHKHWLENQIGGFHLRLSMLDVATIGAGGGSVAYVDRGGMLQVGPRSAGADPGPACYGRGGTEPTVTDAELVLGRLDEGAFLGGRMSISLERATEAIEEHVARPLGLSVVEAAAGIVRVATSHMVDAIELNSVRKGLDPRDFALVAFGGAGPLFAPDIARELAIPAIVVPRFPGIASAMGLLSSDVVHSYSVSLIRLLAEAVHHEVEAAFAGLEERALTQLGRDGFDSKEMVVDRYAECRYAGQGYEIRVGAPSGLDAAGWVDTIAEAFHAAHEREFAHAFRDGRVEIVNVGVHGRGRLGEVRLERLPEATQAPQPVGSREVWFDGHGAVSTAVYARAELRAGHGLEGPALVEQEDSTVLVPPNLNGRVDAEGVISISSSLEGSR